MDTPNRAERIVAHRPRRPRRGKVPFNGVALTRVLYYVVLFGGATVMMVPFLWMISVSLKEPGQVFVYPPQWIPDPIVWANYGTVWTTVPFAMFLLNTTKIAILVTLGQFLTCSLGAYAFARLEFPGRDHLFLAYLGTMMIPYHVTLVPVFILMRYLGWVDSHLSLIVPACFSAFGTFLLRQFFLTIPRELEDAARIDGCSEFGIYSRIVLPLAKPALATLGVFTLLWSWNDFIGPLVFINSTEKKTLTLGLASFQGMYTTDWTLLMAASVMALLPLIIIFIFAQRYFVEGITLSGIKG